MRQVNLKDYIEYNNERFTKRVIFKEGESTVFMLNFLPTQSLPEHNHPGTNVYLLVVNGEGTFTINGENTKVKKNDVILCNGEESLAFVNDGQYKTSLYVMLNKVPNEHYVENI
ncbi:cupin domain-containing protein [Litchfieldia alkalitelluris]|uniref:cupin domain-containing protein n=1 Tax=Litchfieldia alkalitelluris TaxID=304268 RepID=UPI000998581F|nr:cupin domain-containing protein [Litchfieldia alkalitelluris]